MHCCKQNKEFNSACFSDIWYNWYTYIIPTIIVAIVLTQHKIITDIIVSDVLKSILDSIITFVSICVSLIGVLLTLLITIKKDSKMITYFFSVADKQSFRACIKFNICSGLIVIILSSLLYLPGVDNYQIFGNENTFNYFMVAVFYLWIWFLFSYFCSTYRFINILLLLVTEEKVDNSMNVCNEASEEERKRIHELIEKKNIKKD